VPRLRLDRDILVSSLTARRLAKSYAETGTVPVTATVNALATGPYPEGLTVTIIEYANNRMSCLCQLHDQKKPVWLPVKWLDKERDQ
jgi:hypothetical protein